MLYIAIVLVTLFLCTALEVVSDISVPRQVTCKQPYLSVGQINQGEHSLHLTGLCGHTASHCIIYITIMWNVSKDRSPW